MKDFNVMGFYPFLIPLMAIWKHENVFNSLNLFTQLICFFLFILFSSIFFFLCSLLIKKNNNNKSKPAGLVLAWLPETLNNKTSLFKCNYKYKQEGEIKQVWGFLCCKAVLLWKRIYLMFVNFVGHFKYNVKSSLIIDAILKISSKKPIKYFPKKKFF